MSRKLAVILGFVGACDAGYIPVTQPGSQDMGVVASNRIHQVRADFAGQRVILPILWDAQLRDYCVITIPNGNVTVCQTYSGVAQGFPQSAYATGKITIDP